MNKSEELVNRLSIEEQAELKSVELELARYECDLLPEIEVQISLLDQRVKEELDLEKLDEYLMEKLFITRTLSDWAFKLELLYHRQDYLINKARLASNSIERKA